ncbi:MAG TPA: tripartite tricarboxylate transporter substrate binding protein [Burkholderiales bacterium]|nr:tripartite tricarboxylate transporter substrate binding protein [Burkholderiales bacterium]
MLRIVRASLAALLCSLTAGTLLAGAYPERPIRLIVPFAPGGGSDINARIIAEPIGASLGQTLVIDNRPGAGSALGSALAAKAAPDGYTLLLGTISLTINPSVYKELPFDAQRDLIPITRVSDQPSILVSLPLLPPKNLNELLAFVRAQPGKFTFGSAGVGTGSHLATTLLTQKTHTRMLHVPFKGTGPALTALLSGEITVYMSTFASALPHVKAGRLRAYGVTTLTRAELLPDVPTIAEEGVADFEYAAWYGLFAPTGTPHPVVGKVHAAAVKALKSPQVLQLYKAQGLHATPTTSEAFKQYFAAERAKWAAVVREAKIAQQ